MENKFAVMHIEKYKTMSAMTKSYNHNYRRLTVGAMSLGETCDSFKNVQLDKIHLDRELINTYDGSDYAEVWREKFAKMDYYKNNTLRKDAVNGLEIMLTMSHGMVGKVNVDVWAKANVTWLQQTFGIDNVESAMLHMDESTPHIHAFVLPVLDGRFCAKQILGNAIKMRQTQDSYAKAMAQFGLERGISGSHAKHESIKHLHGEINTAIKKANETTKIRKSALGKTESIQVYAERVTPVMEEIIIKLQALERENKRLKQIQDLTIQKDKYYNSIQQNIESSAEITLMAEKWMKIEKIIMEHPYEKVRYSFEKYVDAAEKWYDKQQEIEELDRNNK
jgi:hypothetical protein